MMPPIETVYLIHHTHTDLGYTHDPVTVWECHRRFIDAAIDAAELDAHNAGPDAFRWTVEVTATLLHWLDHATDRQVGRLQALERAGRIEVTGMFAHLTPLASRAAYVESLRPLQRLRNNFGFTVRHAMTCDVNGHNWSLVDCLLDAGITAMSISTNDAFGGHPPGRPDVFWWEAPSKRKLLTLNAWHYHTGNYAGIGPFPIDTFRTHWPTLRAKLERARWPWPFALLQVTHQFGDNGSADFELPDFVRRWNAARTGDEPLLQLATPTAFWDAVRGATEPSVDTRPVRRGDWSDYWNFGAGSAAREMAVARQNEARLITGDQLQAWLKPLGVYEQPTDLPGRSPATTLARSAEFRRRGWQLLNLWNEHTFDADSSQHHPEGQDTYGQWYQKANTVYEGRSVSTMFQRDGLAELSLLIPREPDDALIVYNPLPWARTVIAEVDRVMYEPRPYGTDPAAARHHQDRALAKFIKGIKYLLPTEVPANGYTVVKQNRLLAADAVTMSKYAQDTWEGGGESIASTPATNSPSGPQDPDAVAIENEFFKLAFDMQRGGVASWIDKRTGREWVDTSSPWSFATPVHERVDRIDNPHGVFYISPPWTDVEETRGLQPDWPATRGGAERLLSHAVHRRPTHLEVVQSIEVRGIAGPATVRIILPNHEPTVTFEGSWMMTSDPHPEATYFVLPFDLPGVVARFDVGDQAVRVHEDQLPGTNRDFFTVQRWVDLSNATCGVTVATPTNPLVQLGGFNFARDQQDGRPGRAHFLGWITNNYWPTNFRPCQPGLVTATYVVRPHGDDFDELAAYRHGAEVAQPAVLQSAFEPPRPGASLPRDGSVLNLPTSPGIASQLISVDGEVFATLLNLSDRPLRADLRGGEVLAVLDAEIVSGPAAHLHVADEGLSIDIEPRQKLLLRLNLVKRSEHVDVRTEPGRVGSNE